MEDEQDKREFYRHLDARDEALREEERRVEKAKFWAQQAERGRRINQLELRCLSNEAEARGRAIVKQETFHEIVRLKDLCADEILRLPVPWEQCELWSRTVRCAGFNDPSARGQVDQVKDEIFALLGVRAPANLLCDLIELSCDLSWYQGH